MKSPLVSIVMSVYNDVRYIEDSIISVLNQTYQNLELIIINDGSTDGSDEVIRKYANLDSRIIFINNKKNIGLAQSLNLGITIAKGSYIARMDSDDICVSKRIEIQVSFLINNPEIDVCGTYVSILRDYNNYFQIIKYPLTNKEIKFQLLSNSPLAHPTILGKKNVFLTHRYKNYSIAQDYDLWTRMSLNNIIFANIDQVLLKYRIHKKQTTFIKQSLKFSIINDISDNYFRTFSKMEYLPKLHLHRKCISFRFARHIFQEIAELGRINKISNNQILLVMQQVFRTLSPMSPMIYYAYYLSSRKLHKDVITELLLFIQAFFCINNQSKLYCYSRTLVYGKLSHLRRLF